MMLTSLLTSVVAGALGGIGARVAHTRYKQERRREQLRRAIYTETRANADDIERAATRLKIVDPTSEEVTIPKLTLATTVYESNAESIGLLSSGEVDAVVQYYSFCREFRQLLIDVSKVDELTTPNVSLLRKKAIELHGASMELLQSLESKTELGWEYSSELERLSHEDRYELKPPSEQFSIDSRDGSTDDEG